MKIALLLPPTLANFILKAERGAQLDMLSNPYFLRAYQYLKDKNDIEKKIPLCFCCVNLGK